MLISGISYVGSTKYAGTVKIDYMFVTDFLVPFNHEHVYATLIPC